MSIQILTYEFDGPFRSAGSLQAHGGVYAVITRSRPTDKWDLVDVGESSVVRDRVENHDRAACWRGAALDDGLAVAVLYTSGLTAAQRRAIEAEIRNRFNPPCGVH